MDVRYVHHRGNIVADFLSRVELSVDSVYMAAGHPDLDIATQFINMSHIWHI